jgi:hypothetical protein
MSGVSGTDPSAKCAVVFNVPYKRGWCTVELYPAWPMWNYLEQRAVPIHPGCPPPSQATKDSVYLQLPRRMNLDIVHLRTAQSGTCGYETVYVNIVLYFSSSNTVLWNIPPEMSYPHSTDCCYFLGWLPTPGKKNSTCVHPTFPGCVADTKILYN